MKCWTSIGAIMSKYDQFRGREPALLTVPGLDNSGPHHWQSLWERSCGCTRVELGSWTDPDPISWARNLNDAIAEQTRPVILIAHSLGCHAVAWWSRLDEALTHKVAGALLVAPPEVEESPLDARVKAFAPLRRGRLPFPSVLAASANDPYAAFGRSKRMARTWGSRLVDVGALGHVNADSDIGEWTYGRFLLERLIASVSAEKPALVKGRAAALLAKTQPFRLALGR